MKKKNAIMLGLGAALVAVAGVFMVWKKKRDENNYEQPPKDAPQLDINNPGTQDDFPTSPSESELG